MIESHKMSYISERKVELMKTQPRQVDSSKSNAIPDNQGLMDFILLAMRVEDDFVQRGRIHGA